MTLFFIQGQHDWINDVTQVVWVVLGSPGSADRVHTPCAEANWPDIWVILSSSKFAQSWVALIIQFPGAGPLTTSRGPLTTSCVGCGQRSKDVHFYAFYGFLRLFQSFCMLYVSVAAYWWHSKLSVQFCQITSSTFTMPSYCGSVLKCCPALKMLKCEPHNEEEWTPDFPAFIKN